MAGLLAFLALLLFAVQTLVALHTRSVVTDAAYEGARGVAGARRRPHRPRRGRRRPRPTRGEGPAAARALRREGRARLVGHHRQHGSLTVRARPPGFLWAALRGPGAALIDRTVHVRVEELR